MAHEDHLLKKLWMRFALRGVQFADRHAALDRFYRVEDPWGMESPRELFRFGETNNLIRTHLGCPNRILELGCGEGHQSAELLKISNHLFGMDVSSRAVARARTRCPTATFAVGDITSTQIEKQWVPFDLVVACEVLYYMKDVPAALAAMQRLGKACFVSFVDSRRERLEPLIAAIPHVSWHRIEFQDLGWTAVWWRTTRDFSNHIN
ncbi:class I SAM-dependent DNA methyltransferase [Afipia birgiae]|jgi:SAM-dependent methyltransferase|uniref:class I SAM-dependent DNA methyltransferase n=1 Tax=Afipia birgiae TaxID=151414 RepID=UPI0002E1A7C3|nr:class I SAM-dependent methyltransferase [Afipia birgiae]